MDYISLKLTNSSEEEKKVKIDSDELLISKHCNQSQNKKKRLKRTIHQVNSQS
jgi:hypothetical protein